MSVDLKLPLVVNGWLVQDPAPNSWAWPVDRWFAQHMLTGCTLEWEDERHHSGLPTHQKGQVWFAHPTDPSNFNTNHRGRYMSGWLTGSESRQWREDFLMIGMA